MAIEITYDVPFDGVRLLRAVSVLQSTRQGLESLRGVERVVIGETPALATLQCRWRRTLGCVKRTLKDIRTTVSTMYSGSISV